MRALKVALLIAGATMVALGAAKQGARADNPLPDKCVSNGTCSTHKGCNVCSSPTQPDCCTRCILNNDDVTWYDCSGWTEPCWQYWIVGGCGDMQVGACVPGNPPNCGNWAPSGQSCGSRSWCL
jgi:hypothetical protein